MDLRILLDIARKSILTSFDNSLLLNKEFYLNNFKDLNKISASFVTLTIDERLRGCIGTLQAKKMLMMMSLIMLNYQLLKTHGLKL